MTILRWILIGLAVWTAASFIFGLVIARVFFTRPSNPFDEPSQYRNRGIL